MITIMSVPKTQGIVRRITGLVPNALVLGCLIGMLYWGHTTHWSFSGHREPETGPEAAGHSSKSTETLAGKSSVGAPSATGSSWLRTLSMNSPEDAQKAGLMVAEAE